jgi:hypothetical protein
MAKETGAGSSFTNHPGVIDYKGKSYFFYHDGALPGGGDYKRSVCVEEFTYNADGSIPTIKMSTAGPSPLQTLDPFSQVEAETIAFSSGLKTETCTDTGGGMDVTSINDGDYIKVKNVDFQAGVTSFDARVTAAASSAKIELHLDSQSGTPLGTCDVSGATAWTTKTCAVSGGSGKHDLFLKFSGGNGDLFKFNWWKFTGPTTSNGVGGAGGVGGMSGAAGVGGATAGVGGASSGGGTGNMSGGVAGASIGTAGHSSADAGTSGAAIAGTTGGGVAGGTGSAGIGAGGAQPTGGTGPTSGANGGATSAGGAPSAGTGGGRAERAATDVASGAKPGNSAGCGCRASSRADHTSPVATLLLLGLGLRRRRAR